ncbi:MAG: ABC transporter ATP-binding protein [Elusimicrobiota bacterium]
MIYKRLLKYIDPYIGRFAVALACIAVYSAMTGALPFTIQWVLDKVLIPRDLRMLYAITMAIVGVSAVRSIAGFGQNYLTLYIAQNVTLKIREELYDKLISLSHDFYSRHSTPRLMARVTNDVNALYNSISRVPTNIIRDGLTVIVMIGVLFYYNWKFALILMVFFPVASIPLASFARKMRDASRKGQKQMGELYSYLQESLAGINIIKSFVRQKHEIERFKEENRKYYHTQHQFIRVDARSSPIMEFIGGAVLAGVLFYGGLLVTKGAWQPGDFFAFLTAAGLLYTPLKNFAQTNSLMQQAAAGAERIFEILDEKPSVTDVAGAVSMPKFSKEISFNDISFHYPEKNNIIEKLSLSIKSGESVAFVGPSGAGKTTLALLLARFYDPQEGSIAIDGTDIRKITIDSLRSQIGVVTQDTILFNESIKYNIAYGRDGASDEEIISAAKTANAHQFILKMPHGYDTVIGERGLKLSGGERQRVAIARAMLKNPPILILDEATSALDAESEKLVQEAIEHLMVDRTVLLIAHRLATVKKADRIIVVDKGKIVEIGTHHELLEKKGIYSRLHTLQLL